MTEDQINTIKDVCMQYGVSYLGLFGSYARGDQKKGSDVDLLVEYSPTSRVRSMFDAVELEMQLESILQSKVDLVSKKYLNPLIKDFVYKDLKVLYEE